ncbi:hypothetical protein ACOME3_010293 [Neoechinorhynchus agilis]
MYIMVKMIQNENSRISKSVVFNVIQIITSNSRCPNYYSLQEPKSETHSLSAVHNGFIIFRDILHRSCFTGINGSFSYRLLLIYVIDRASSKPFMELKVFSSKQKPFISQAFGTYKMNLTIFSSWVLS